MNAVSLEARLALFEEHGSPKIVSAFTGHDVMVVKAKGTPNTGNERTAAARERV